MARQFHIGFIANIANKSEREKYTGVLQYAATHPEVLIEEFNPVPFSSDVSKTLIQRWSLDGIIISAPTGYPFVRKSPPAPPSVSSTALTT